MALLPTSARNGSFTIAIDGAWDIEDLLALSEAFAESYGYFYALVATDEEAAKKIHETIQKRFWSGDVESKRFGNMLYRMIPQGDALKLKSFSYASPGSLTLLGILPALYMAARVAKAWAAAGNDLLELWQKVEDFFEKRRKRKKQNKDVVLDDAMVTDVDEARGLVLLVGEKLGFDALSAERVIDITGNPITALKYMVALANEARKLTALENSGLLKLPATPAGQMPLGQAPKKGMRRGIQVETIKRRTPKKR